MAYGKRKFVIGVVAGGHLWPPFVEISCSGSDAAN